MLMLSVRRTVFHVTFGVKAEVRGTGAIAPTQNCPFVLLLYTDHTVYNITALLLYLVFKLSEGSTTIWK